MKFTRRHAVFGFAALGGSLAFASRNAVTATRPGTAFGTIVHLTVSARSSSDADLAIDKGFAEIRAVEKAFNLFDSKSELSRLNVEGELHNPSPMMMEVIRTTSDIHDLTQGAFDPSVQPLWNAWQGAALPDENQIASAKSFVSWRNLEIKYNHLQLAQGSALTFNGIAQGYAADRVMMAIKHLALSAVVDTGEFGLSTDDDISKLAIQHPRNPKSVIGNITTQSGFVATSGDYATTFTPDFMHHHIFDPARGASPTELSAVTVLAPTGALADGLATAFMVMGHKSTLALAEKIDGVEVLMIAKSGDVTMSSGMNKHFQPA
jgi:FAD:protein FMN transferase